MLEEKASRVVEVLLARPGSRLLAGKIAGIGLLGLAQMGVTARAALVAVPAVHSIDVPAVRGPVLAWALVSFVLGCALYATVCSTLWIRSVHEVWDAHPVSPAAGGVVIVVAWFASFATIGRLQPRLRPRRSRLLPTERANRHPQARRHRAARLSSGPWFATASALAAIAGLVVLDRRMYAQAVLRGTTLGLRRRLASRAASSPAPARTAPREAAPPAQTARCHGRRRATIDRIGSEHAPLTDYHPDQYQVVVG